MKSNGAEKEKLLEGMELEVMQRQRGISGVVSTIGVTSHGAE